MSNGIAFLWFLVAICITVGSTGLLMVTVVWSFIKWKLPDLKIVGNAILAILAVWIIEFVLIRIAYY